MRWNTFCKEKYQWWLWVAEQEEAQSSNGKTHCCLVYTHRRKSRLSFRDLANCHISAAPLTAVRWKKWESNLLRISQKGPEILWKWGLDCTNLLKNPSESWTDLSHIRGGEISLQTEQKNPTYQSHSDFLSRNEPFMSCGIHYRAQVSSSAHICLGDGITKCQIKWGSAFCGHYSVRLWQVSQSDKITPSSRINPYCQK